MFLRSLRMHPSPFHTTSRVKADLNYRKQETRQVENPCPQEAVLAEVRGQSHLAVLVVLQPALQVGGVSARVEAALVKGLQRLRGRSSCAHHGMEGVVERCRVLVGPLVLWASTRR